MKRATPEANARTTRAILVALGADEMRERVCRELGDLGCPVLPLSDGYRLVEHMADALLDQRCDARPALIVADAVLPGCAGLSVLAGVRTLGWDTPVILVTALGDHRARDAAWTGGVSGIFVDPVDARELRNFAELILDPACASIAGGRGPAPPHQPRQVRENSTLGEL